MQAQANVGGFVSYAEEMKGTKVRGRSEKFFDHFSQAKLFYNSQSPPEKAILCRRSNLNWARWKSLQSAHACSDSWLRWIRHWPVWSHKVSA